MTDQQGEIVRISDALYKFQIERMAIESAEARTWQIVAVLLALLFGVLAAWLITRQITRPLQDTLGAVQRIADGDLIESARITRRDELGILQQGVGADGRHPARADQRHSRWRGADRQRCRAAFRRDRADQRGCRSCARKTDQVATAMHEMSATVQEVARNAEQASNAATAADAEARQGDRVVAAGGGADRASG